MKEKISPASSSLFIFILLLLILTPFVFDFNIEDRYIYRLSKETFMDIIIIIMLAPFVIEILNSKEKGIFFKNVADTPFFAPFLLIVIASCFSLINCSSFPFNFRDFFSLFCGFLLFLMVIITLNNNQRIDWIIYIILLGAIITCFYCIFQYFGIDPILKLRTNPPKFKRGYMRVIGFIDNPNTLSNYLILIPPIAMADFLRKKTISDRIVPIVALISTVLTLFLASSMAGISSLIASTMIFIFFLLKIGNVLSGLNTRIMLILLSIILIFGVILTFIEPDMLRGVKKLRSQLDPTKSERLLIWESAFRMIKEEPIIGIGFGNFKVKYLDYRACSLKGDEIFKGKWEFADLAHCDYLQVAAESGLFAAFAMIWAVIILIKSMIINLKFERDNRDTHENTQPDYLLLGLHASLIAIAINAMATFPFHLATSALLTIIFLGIASNKLTRSIAD